MKSRMMAGMVCVAMGLMAACGAPAAQLGRSRPETVDNTRTGSGKATGLQLTLFTPLQIFPASYDVYGLRLNLIYGLNQNLRGLDLGLVNVGAGFMEGVQLGAANRVGELTGMQLGIVNSAGRSDGAFQLGLINHAGEFAGLQLAVINYARNFNGAQIGLVNLCDTTAGVQLGLINIISQSDTLVFCPLFNAQF